jgi:hypothetical protein
MLQPYTSVYDIKAKVKLDWNHKNHKFYPGSYVEVNRQIAPRDWITSGGKIMPGHSYESKIKRDRVGRVGRVVAVTCTPNGKTRGKAENGMCERMFTRYYVQFPDGIVLGFHSHHLDKAFRLDF